VRTNLLTGLTAWIGFNDLGAEGIFQWASGQPVTYTNWASSYPYGTTLGAAMTVPT